MFGLLGILHSLFTILHSRAELGLSLVCVVSWKSLVWVSFRVFLACRGGCVCGFSARDE